MVERKSGFLVIPVILLLSLLFSGCSNNLFYMPRGYTAPDHLRLLTDPAVIAIDYSLQDAEQTAFFIGSRQPETLWLLFGGINSLALDWHQWFARMVDEKTSFFLIDYPGYGLNHGVPRAEKIFASSVTAFTTLLQYLDFPPGAGKLEVNVLGHSLGTGVAIAFADRIPVDSLFLIAPFTDLKELISYRYGRVVGALINIINQERYPNEETLEAVIARQKALQVVIIHGEQDRQIPVAMGRRLAELLPETGVYREIPEAGHQNMFAEHLDMIAAYMKGEQ